MQDTVFATPSAPAGKRGQLYKGVHFDKGRHTWQVGRVEKSQNNLVCLCVCALQLMHKRLNAASFSLRSLTSEI